MFGSCRTKTIQRRDRDRPHPATFPVRLVEMCLKLHGTARIHTAMDPFVGIGNAAVSATRLGLPFIGVDVDAEYLNEAVARVRAEGDTLFSEQAVDRRVERERDQE
jgi:site-specific DNA-methyltransferase (adenine-specific)